MSKFLGNKPHEGQFTMLSLQLAVADTRSYNAQAREQAVAMKAYADANPQDVNYAHLSNYFEKLNVMKTPRPNKSFGMNNGKMH